MIIRLSAIALLAVFLTSFPAASAEPEQTSDVTLTGIEDFEMSVVFRPLFPGFADRNPIVDQARWQINGDQTGSTGTLGIFAVFDIDGGLFAGAGSVSSIEQIEFILPPAVNQDTGSGGIATAGDVSIYFTTNDVDVLDPSAGIIFDNGGGTDPTGLGDQFEDLTLLTSEFQESGIYDIERLVDPADFGDLQQWLLQRINDGDNIRFLLASQTPGFTANFGTGNEDTSPNFDFFGLPPLVTFTVTSQVDDEIFRSRFESGQ